MPRVYVLNDELAEWLDKWAEREGDGGFQDKAAAIARSEVTVLTGLFQSMCKERERIGIEKAIECLQALQAAEESDG